MQTVSLTVAASGVAPAGWADFRSPLLSSAPAASGHIAPAPAGVLVVADASDAAIGGLLLATTAPVVRIGGEPDPLATLTGEIAARQPRTLHFVSHGEPGRVHLGTAVVDTALVHARAAELRSWGVKEIALWSCNVAQDEVFLKALAEATGATIHGSTGAVGSAVAGGTWRLDRSTEVSPEIAPPFAASALAEWPHVLASIYFNKVHLGTGAAYTINTNSIAITNAVVGASFRFTSENAADVSFSGNNVAGRLSWVVGATTTTKSGVISRRKKAGSNNLAFYFVECGLTAGLIDQNLPTGTAFLLIEPPDEANAAVTANQSVTTDSSPVLSDLNDFLATQSTQPVATFANAALGNIVFGEAAVSAVFTLNLSNAASGTWSFTPTLTGGTATIGTDTGASLQYSTDNGANWSAVGAGVSLASTVVSVKLRVSIVDDAAAESNETFYIATGTISGGGIQNNGGTSATGEIADNDSATPTITITPGTYTYSGAAQGPLTSDVNTGGSTGAITLSYVGTGTTAYGPSATPPTAAGTYTVTASVAADASYNAATSGATAFTIGRKAASVTPTAATKTFGAVDPTLTGTLSGFVAADNVTATYSRTAGETVAGSPYTVSATLSPTGALANYTVTSNTANFTITQATPTITVTPGTYTYSSAAQGPLTTDVNTGGSTGAITLSYVGTGTTAYGPSATPPTAAGTYTVTASVAADASYNAATSGATAFTIGKVN